MRKRRAKVVPRRKGWVYAGGRPDRYWLGVDRGDGKDWSATFMVSLSPASQKVPAMASAKERVLLEWRDGLLINRGPDWIPDGTAVYSDARGPYCYLEAQSPASQTTTLDGRPYVDAPKRTKLVGGLEKRGWP